MYFCSKLNEQKKQLSTFESQIKILQDSYKSQSDIWTKEKSRLEVRASYNYIRNEIIKIPSRSVSLFILQGKLNEHERSANNFMLEESKEEVNRLMKENNSLKDQVADVRRIVNILSIFKLPKTTIKH